MIFIYKNLKNRIAKEIVLNKAHSLRLSRSHPEESNLDVNREQVKTRIASFRWCLVVYLIFIGVAGIYLATGDHLINDALGYSTIALIVVCIYANLHNLTNHIRWIDGEDLLDSKQFVMLAIRRPITTVAKALRTKIL